MNESKKRKPNRLKNYDYSQNGVYFVTVCIKDRIPILSRITVGANCVRLSEIGLTVEREIQKLNTVYDSVFISDYVIMPNHVHLIICIDAEQTMPAPTVSRIVKQFKGSITKKIGQSIWQKGFYDHIIRDDSDYLIKKQYISDNPIKWSEDELYFHQTNDKC